MASHATGDSSASPQFRLAIADRAIVSHAAI
jgi:hypothetical protein